MKKSILYLMAVLFAAVLFTACDNDNDNNGDLTDEVPTVFQADNNWFEDSIQVGDELWYKVVGEETFTTLYVEWSEAEFHGDSRNYTADIKVSAYQLDGETPYFEDKNNGYKDSKKSIALSGEKEVLLKVELNDETKPGTFALRCTGTGATEIEYIDLPIQDEWTDATIEDGEVIGYRVDCGDIEKVNIIWAEVDSPEEGYTAEIMGSVFHKDGETPYKQIDKDDDFLNKNNSHSDKPKGVLVDQDEKKIKIHISVNTTPGKFAIKVVERVE